MFGYFAVELSLLAAYELGFVWVVLTRDLVGDCLPEDSGRVNTAPVQCQYTKYLHQHHTCT